MTHIFYLFLFIFIYYEISVIGNAERIVKRVEEYKNTPKDEKLEYLSQNYSLVFHFIFNLFYFSYVFVGLFTSQWWLFLTIIAMSFIPKKKPLARKIDAIVTVAILLFILINKYYLHINIL